MRAVVAYCAKRKRKQDQSVYSDYKMRLLHDCKMGRHCEYEIEANVRSLRIVIKTVEKSLTPNWLHTEFLRSRKFRLVGRVSDAK